MKDILVLLGILVLVWIVVMTSGCTQTYYKPMIIPIRSNTQEADCIIRKPDGTPSLAICPKPFNNSNI